MARKISDELCSVLVSAETVWNQYVTSLFENQDIAFALCHAGFTLGRAKISHIEYLGSGFSRGVAWSYHFGIIRFLEENVGDFCLDMSSYVRTVGALARILYDREMCPIYKEYADAFYPLPTEKD